MKKILVIRFRRVGDAVISATLCSSLKKMFPEAEIHYVLNRGIAPLFEHHPAIDRLITFSGDELDNIPRYVRKVWRTVRRERYDMIVDTRSTTKTLLFSLFSLQTKYRLGMKKWYSRFMLNGRTDTSYDGTRDNVQTTLALLDPLARDFEVAKDEKLTLVCTEREKRKFRGYMQTQGIDFARPVIVCNVTARDSGKVWPAGHMAETLGRIISKHGAQLIFNFGDKREKEEAGEIRRMVGGDGHIFMNVEAGNLRELLALLANSDFFFGNEGGPRHIAQAVEVPSFAIYSPGIELNNWLPGRSERYQGIELGDTAPAAVDDPGLSHAEKFALIDVESVWQRLDPMLERFLQEKQR